MVDEHGEEPAGTREGTEDAGGLGEMVANPATGGPAAAAPRDAAPAEPEGDRTAERGLGSRFHKLWAASTVSNLGQGAAAIAFPWLATTLTHNPVLIALNGVAVRLPWLLFSLPAGVLADRLDRRRVLVAMSAARAGIVGVVALLVAWDAVNLPLLYCCALVLGFVEVLFDNTAQVLTPSVVDRKRLAAANGRLMSAQIVADSFLARPLSGALIAVAVAAPFVFDATAAVVSLVLLLTLRGHYRAGPGIPAQPGPAATAAAAGEPGAAAGSTGGERGTRNGQDGKSATRAAGLRLLRADIREGVAWLWRHPLVRPLAISLAVLNLVGAAVEANYVLFAQEILDLGPVGFAVLTSVLGVGGLLGGLCAAGVVARLGTARSLLLLIGLEVTAHTTAALASNVYLVGAGSVAVGFGSVVWNVTTVSLRQSLVPDRLLGRVNSVYRLLGWGSIPLGMVAGGALVSAVEALWGREAGLRAPFVLGAVLVLAMVGYMRHHLNERAIREALAASRAKPA